MPLADMMALAPPQDDDLVRLITTARAEHLAVGHALGDALHHAMLAGDALIAMRQLVPAGHWQAHLRCRLDISERSARVYVQVAKARADLDRQSSAGPLSIAAAVKYLKGPEKKAAMAHDDRHDDLPGDHHDEHDDPPGLAADIDDPELATAAAKRLQHTVVNGTAASVATEETTEPATEITTETPVEISMPTLLAAWQAAGPDERNTIISELTYAERIAVVGSIESAPELLRMMSERARRDLTASMADQAERLAKAKTAAAPMSPSSVDTLTGLFRLAVAPGNPHERLNACDRIYEKLAANGFGLDAAAVTVAKPKKAARRAA
jgi:hypothetical protein